MPKGKTPSLLSAGNGGITTELTQRQSKCGRCSAAIAGGSRVGQLKCQKAGFTTQKRLCLNCTEEILQKTQEDLDSIKKLFQ